MAQFINYYDVDLWKPSNPMPLRQMACEGDVRGLRVGAVVTSNGDTVSLGGSCVGKVVRADGATVTLTGVINGNIAYVVLDQASCSIEGPIQVAVCWVSGSDVTTLVVAYGTVVNTQTGVAIQPSTPIPDLAQLLAAISDMQTATAAANAAASGALGNFAPAFAEATANAAGSYVTYTDGKLYYLPSGHTANVTWANTTKTAVTVGAELSDLKSAITEPTSNMFNPSWLQLTGWVVDGDECYGMAQAVYDKYKTAGAPFPFTTFKADTQYTFSLKAKVSGSVTTSNCFRFLIYYTDSTYSYACTVLNNTSDYTTFTSTSTSGKTIDHVNTSYGDGLANTLYLKEIEVVEGTAAIEFIPHITAKDIIARNNIAAQTDRITETGKYNIVNLVETNEVISGSLYPNASNVLVHETNSKRMHLANNLPISQYEKMELGITNGWRAYSYQLDANGAYLTRSGWKTSDYEETIVTGAVYYQVVYGLATESANVDPATDKNNINLFGLSTKFKNFAIDSLQGTIADITYNIPSYWDSEIAASETSIRTNELSMGKNGVEFFFVTDTHWSENAKHSGEIIAKMSHDLGVPLVVFDGDAIDTHSATKAGAVSEIRTFYDAYNKDFRLLSSIGNHDLNSNNNSDTTTWLSDSELYALMMRRQEAFMDTGAEVYNYYDNESQKVRFIQFKTVNGDALSQTVLNWIDARVNELSADWTVVLLSHVYFNGAAAGSPVTIPTGAASNAQHFASLNSTANATIACWIVGHTHRDTSDTTNGILVICTSCDVYTQSAAYGGPTMTLGTNTEQCIDCYQIDTANKSIKITRIGAGSDRTFSYS